MSSRLSRGSSQLGDQFQRKNRENSTAATGSTNTSIGRRLRSPIAKQAPAKNRIVGSAEDEGRDQVVGEQERPADLGGLGVGHDVVEEDHRQQVHREDARERDDHGEELAPHVLARRQRGGVQDLADLQLVVADHGHAGDDGDEEGVEGEHEIDRT